MTLKRIGLRLVFRITICRVLEKGTATTADPAFVGMMGAPKAAVVT
jgi:hypothetical protein